VFSHPVWHIPNEKYSNIFTTIWLRTENDNPFQSTLSSNDSMSSSESTPRRRTSKEGECNVCTNVIFCIRLLHSNINIKPHHFYSPINPWQTLLFSFLSLFWWKKGIIYYLFTNTQPGLQPLLPNLRCNFEQWAVWGCSNEVTFEFMIF
jgi:hypothetical protein